MHSVDSTESRTNKKRSNSEIYNIEVESLLRLLTNFQDLQQMEKISSGVTCMAGMAEVPDFQPNGGNILPLWLCRFFSNLIVSMI